MPGKLANFTILAENPVTVDPMRIKDIKVWGTVQEGRVLPVMHGTKMALSNTADNEPPGDTGTERTAIPDELFSQQVGMHLAGILSHDGH